MSKVVEEEPPPPPTPTGAGDDTTEMPPEIHRVQDERTPEVRVHVKGRRRLNEALLEKFIGPLRMCDTYGELHDTLNRTIRDLEELNAFEDIRATVDHTPGSPPGSADVTLEVVEKQRNYEAGVDMNRLGEPGADMSMNIPYIFGGLSSASLRYNRAWPGSQMLNATVNIPKLRGVGITPASEGWELEVEASRDTTDLRGYSSCRGVATGLAAVFTDRATGRHTLTLSSTLRDLLPEIQPARQGGGEAEKKTSASYAVRRLPLRTMKSSCKYAYTRDDLRFDEAEEGSSHAVGGSLMHAYADLTPGVFGDVSFLKLAALSEYHGYLWRARDWTWEAGVSGGLIVHPSTQAGVASITPLQDRFFLGGGAVDPISGLRGFRYRSAGPAAPRVGGAPGADPTYDYTGGDMLLSAHVQGSMPITFLNNLRTSSDDTEPPSDYDDEFDDDRDGGTLSIHMRAFAFAQAGCLIEKPQLNTERLFGDLKDGLRASAGVGLSLPFLGTNLLELSFAFPMVKKASDAVQRLQLGARLRGLLPTTSWN